MSGPAVSRVEDSELEGLLVTDTIPLADDARDCSKIEVVSVGQIIGEAINRIHGGDSVSSIFEHVQQSGEDESGG